MAEAFQRLVGAQQRLDGLQLSLFTGTIGEGNQQAASHDGLHQIAFLELLDLGLGGPCFLAKSKHGHSSS
ncbi:hypothetical protein D3C84_845280 [compost metagenome]